MSNKQIKCASQLKARVEASGHAPYFFTRNNMKFARDTMRNYGVRGPVKIKEYTGNIVDAWELYRRKPVKHGLCASAYKPCLTHSNRRTAKRCNHEAPRLRVASGRY